MDKNGLLIWELVSTIELFNKLAINLATISDKPESYPCNGGSGDDSRLMQRCFG